MRANRTRAKLTPDLIRHVRHQMAAGTTSTEIEERGLCAASTARSLRNGNLHPELGGPMAPGQMPPVSKAYRRKLLDQVLESRRVFGTNPGFGDVEQAVAGKVLSGRTRQRVHRLLKSSVRCIDRILENIGPPDPLTSCRLWGGLTRKRSWSQKDGTPREVFYPAAVDPTDRKGLIDPKRVICQLASIPIQVRQRISMACGNHLCCESRHFVIGGVIRGK